jgi:hypothetical protein
MSFQENTNQLKVRYICACKGYFENYLFSSGNIYCIEKKNVFIFFHMRFFFLSVNTLTKSRKVGRNEKHAESPSLKHELFIFLV